MIFPSVSVVVLTKNEARDLPDCLRSVAWSDDIHVFDSFSSDNTTEIARAFGAHVSQRIFDGYATQRNAALHSLHYKHPWLLILDADERIPLTSAKVLSSFAAAAPAGVSACRMRRRDYFLGTWLAHAQISPYYVRFVRPSDVYYEREINEVLKVNGGTRDIEAPFDHYPFSKGIRHWVDKHNLYSTMEAEHIIRTRHTSVSFSTAGAFLARDFNQRRFHQKELFYRMPARPLLKWVYMMLVRRAFLDGRAGITYAFLQAFYEYMIVIKTREIETEASSQQPTDAPAHAVVSTEE